MNSFQQAILFILLILGSAILVSLAVLMLRKRAFEVKLNVVTEEREASRRASAVQLEKITLKFSSGAEASTCNVKSGICQSLPNAASVVEERAAEIRCYDNKLQWIDTDEEQITVADTLSRSHQHHYQAFPMAGIEARPDFDNDPRHTNLYAEDSPRSIFEGVIRGTQKFFASKGLISRNSQFHGLTPAERDKLGGVEYKAVSLLSIIVFLYLIMFLGLGIIGIGVWLLATHPEIARENGLSPFWTGAFFAVSAFTNSGMALLDKNMTALQLQ